jgi:site-specific DNA recombinase
VPEPEKRHQMLRTACYARFSSDLQRDTSIDDQVRECRDYARRQGWVWQQQHVYTDKAISGSSIEGRRGLEALLTDAAQKPRPFDVLLVDDSSRVARDLADALRVMQQLRFAGVRVIYISQGIDSASEQADTLVAVHGLVDGLYLREMAAKIKRGLRGQAERGYATGSITYGYKTVPESDPNRSGEVVGFRVQIDEREASTVRQIFEWYADGVTLPEILLRLTKRHAAVAPRGRTWKRGAIDRMLVNERYLGRQIWGQRRHERKPGTRKKVARSVPRREWTIIQRPDLRIVDEELWERVQARRRAAAAISNKHRQPGSTRVSGRAAQLHSKTLFGGLLRCGQCGGTISIVSTNYVKGVLYRYYGCYRAHRNGPSQCGNRVTASVDTAERLLLAGTQHELTRPETVDHIVEWLKRELLKRADITPAQLEALERRRADLKKKMKRLIDTIENGGGGATITAALGSREGELAQVEREIAALKAKPVNARIPVIMPAWVKQQLGDAAGVLATDVSRAKTLLSELSITGIATPVYDDGPRPFLRVSFEGAFEELAFARHVRLRGRAASGKSSLRAGCIS